VLRQKQDSSTGERWQDIGPDDGSADLTEQVRDALRHLYDYAYLQTHVLTRFTQQDQNGVSSSAGQQLGRQLQAAITALQPETGSTAPSAANRRTRLLRLRYLDEMEAPAVQQTLAISRSTYQREHAVALRAITSLLQKRWSGTVPAPHAGAAGAQIGPAERTYLTSFVGRERELAEVDRLLVRPAPGRPALPIQSLSEGVAAMPTGLGSSH
jgi:hypothetical protein